MDLDEYAEHILRELKEYIDNVLDNKIIDNEFITTLEEKAKQIRNWYNRKIDEITAKNPIIDLFSK